MIRLFIVLACSLPLLVAAGESPPYTVALQVLVRSGDASPDGNGVFSNELGIPHLNDSGQVAFLAKLLATTDPGTADDFGLYRADEVSVQTMVRGGVPSAAGNTLELDPLILGTIRAFRLFGIDRSGRVAFIAVDDANMDAIYRTDGSTVETIIQEDEDTAFGDNVQIGPAATTLIVNDEGQISYQVIASTPTSQIFLLRSDGPNHQVLYQSGQVLPGGSTLGAFRSYSLNNAGQVLSRLNTGSTTFGYFQTDGVTSTNLVETGQPAVDGLGSYTAMALFPPGLNDAGDAALILAVDDITTDYIGLFTHDGANLSEITRTGNATFGGDLLGYLAPPKINGNGTLAYVMAAGSNLPRLVLRRGGADVQVTFAGDQLPPPIDVTVSSLATFVLNESDQLLFLASVAAGGPPAISLLFYDPVFGLAEVARVGLPFAGGILTTLEAATPFSPLDTNASSKNAQNGLNNLGQIAFRYTLDNGEAGIALARVQYVLPDDLFKDSFESLLLR